MLVSSTTASHAYAKVTWRPFLKLSGQQGMFVDTAHRHGIQTSISWIEKQPGETSSAYHERAVAKEDLGIVTNANRLVWRKKLA